MVQECSTFVGTMTYLSPKELQGTTILRSFACPVPTIYKTHIYPSIASNRKEYSYAADVWAVGLSALTCAVGEFGTI